MRTFFHSLSKEIIFAIFFAFLALISLSFFFFPGETSRVITKKIAGDAITITSTPMPSPAKQIEEKILVTPLPSEKEKMEESKTIQITIVVTATPAPTNTSSSEKATVSVTVDGNSFSLTLDKGKTQCDVLQNALQEKKISQLLMKYESFLDSYGVYQINGVGKENAVWWTYEVNGKAPNTGCNHIAANNGDSISWKYVGQR